jgi:acyl transferase domain-containing protein
VKAAFTASSANILVDQIRAALESDQDVGIRTSVNEGSRKKILGIFTGQGAQWPGMGRALAHHSEFVRGRLRDFDNILSDALPVVDRPQWSLESVMTADGASFDIDRTEYSQPLCTAVQVILVDLLHAVGVRFDAVVGHSSGKYCPQARRPYLLTIREQAKLPLLTLLVISNGRML